MLHPITIQALNSSGIRPEDEFQIQRLDTCYGVRKRYASGWITWAFFGSRDDANAYLGVIKSRQEAMMLD